MTYRRFKGTATDYVALHNRIKSKLDKPKECSICECVSSRLELANLTQKYTEELDDWAYMCAVCHKRYDSAKFHLKGKVWSKYCVKCREIKSLDSFYLRKGTQTVNGKVYKRVDTTSFCKSCTRDWDRENRKKKMTLK